MINLLFDWLGSLIILLNLLIDLALLLEEENDRFKDLLFFEFCT